MKRLAYSLILSAALSCGVVWAADPPPINVCTGQVIVGTPLWYTDINSTSVFDCTPIASATATRPYFYVNTAGVLVYHYCKVGPSWHRFMYAATWGFLTGKNLASGLRDASIAADPLAAFATLTKANVGTPLSDPSLTPVWCPAMPEMLANWPKADVVAGEGWIVTPSGSAPTRPAYPVINGKRSTSTGSSAVVRASCSCSTLKIVESGAVYCLIPPVSLVPTTTLPHVAGCFLPR